MGREPSHFRQDGHLFGGLEGTGEIVEAGHWRRSAERYGVVVYLFVLSV